jgi:hypothetical protein
VRSRRAPLAQGDDYSRELLREQLEAEELERPVKNVDDEGGLVEIGE